MRTFAFTYRSMKMKWILLATLMLVLAACQPTPGPKTMDTPAVPPAELPTTAPSATAGQPTSLPEPSASPTQPAASAPQLLRETSVTYPYRLVWSNDGNRLGVFAEGGFTLFNAETFDVLATRSLQSPAAPLDLSPDGKTFAFTPDGVTIQLEDLDSGQAVRSITPGGIFQRAIFSPDGRWLAVDSMDQIAYTLWDVASGQQGAVLGGFVTAAPVYAADFSPSGNKLIWHSRGTIQVMDIATATLSASIGHEDFITAFALSPDDNLLATAAGGTFKGEFTALINLWNPQTGERIAVYPQTKFANALAFSPDGAMLAVASGADVLLLDPASGQTMQSFTASGDAVTSLGFSPDGAFLATTGSDGTLRLWSLR